MRVMIGFSAVEDLERFRKSYYSLTSFSPPVLISIYSIAEPSLELVLPDELQESLRLLKPEGNLLKERFRNVLVRGKLETRRPITQWKKKRRSITEKWSYKDFKI